MFEIWEQLSGYGYTDKTFEEFQNQYSSEEGRKVLHGKLAANNLTSKTFEEFSSTYFTEPDPKAKPVQLFGYDLDQNKFNTEDEEEFANLLRPVLKERGFSITSPINPFVEMVEITAPNGKKAKVSLDNGALGVGVLKRNEVESWMNSNLGNEDFQYFSKKYGAETLSDIGNFDYNREENTKVLEALDTAIDLGLSRIADAKDLSKYGITAAANQGISIAMQAEDIEPYQLNNAIQSEAMLFLRQSGYLEALNLTEDRAEELVSQLLKREGTAQELLQVRAQKDRQKVKARINGVEMTTQEYEEEEKNIVKQHALSDQALYNINKKIDTLKDRLLTAEGDAKIQIQRQIEELKEALKSDNASDLLKASGMAVPSGYVARINKEKDINYTPFTNLSTEQIEDRKKVISSQLSYDSDPATLRESLKDQLQQNLREQKMWNLHGINNTITISRKDLDDTFLSPAQEAVIYNILPKLGYDYFTDKNNSWEIPLADLYEADTKRMGASKLIDVSEEFGPEYKSYKNWRTNIEVEQAALSELYLFNKSPEMLEKNRMADFVASAIGATGLLGSDKETKLALSTNRNTKDIVQTFANNYNDKNSDEIEIGNLALLSFNDKQAEALERSFTDNVIEGTGAFIPIIAEFAAIEYVTGGAATYLGITRAIDKMRRVGGVYNKMKIAAYRLAYEEMKTQMAGFKTGSGVAFAGAGMVLPNAKFKALGGFANGFVNKVIKGGISGAGAGEAAAVTEAFIGQFTHDENFQHFLDVNFRNATDREILERLAVSATTFSIIGATHLKKSDVSYRAFKAETLQYETSSRALDIKIDLLEKINRGEMTFEEGAEIMEKINLPISKEMLEAENIEGLKDMRFNINNLLNARREEGKWDPESPTFVEDATAYIKKSFKNSGLELGEGKDITVKFVDSYKELEGGEKNDTAKWIPEKNELQFIKSKFSGGKLAHEMFHAGLKAYFHKKPGELRKFNENLVNIINKTIGERGEILSAFIKETYGLDFRKNLDKNIQAEELMSNLVEIMTDPYVKSTLGYIKERGLMHEITDAIYNFAEKNGFGKYLPSISRGQDLIDFMGRFAYNVNTGKDVSRQLKRLADIPLFGDNKKYIKAAKSFSAKEGSPEFERLKKDIFKKAVDAYNDPTWSNDPMSRALMTAMEFRPIVQGIADRRYGNNPNYTDFNRELFIDEVTTGLGGIKESKFADKEDKQLKGQSLVSVVLTWDPAKEASLTSHVYGQINNRMDGFAKLPDFNLAGKEVRETETRKLENIAEDTSFYDTSSPDKVSFKRVSKKKAFETLGLSEKLQAKVDQVAERILKFPLPNLEAIEIGEAINKNGEKIELYVFQNNVGYRDLTTGEIKLFSSKIRNLKGAVAFLNSKGEGIKEEPTKLGSFKQRQMLELRNELYNELQEEAGPTSTAANAPIRSNGQRLGGTAASPQYKKFIEKAFPLFKNYFSQSSINLRFKDFADPIIDSKTGKQESFSAQEIGSIRAATNVKKYKKKNITLEEWKSYFEGDGSIRIDGRRRALLETIAEEIGFDAITEKAFDEAKQEQIRSRQEALGVDLVENFAVLLGKQLDRSVDGKINFSSKNIAEAFAELQLIHDIENIKNVLSNPELLIANPDIYEFVEKVARDNLKNAVKNIIKDETRFVNAYKEAGGDLSKLGNLNRKKLTEQEVEDYTNNLLNHIFTNLPKELVDMTAAKQERKGKKGSFLKALFGWTRGELLAKNYYDAKPIEKIGKTFSEETTGKEAYKKLSDFLELTKEKDGAHKAIASTINSLNKHEQALFELSKNKDINEAKKQVAEYAAKNSKEIKELHEATNLLLDGILLTIQHQANTNTKFNLKAIAPLFMANDGMNLIRLLSPFTTVQLSKGNILKYKNEHLEAKAKFAGKVFYEIEQGTLTPERLNQLKENWRSIIGSKNAQRTADRIIGYSFSDPSVKLAFIGRQGFAYKKGDDIGFRVDKGIENLKELFNFIEGKSEYDLLIEATAKGLLQDVKGITLNKLVDALNYNYEQSKTEVFTMSSKSIADEFDGMLERKSGLKGFISASRARQLGKGKGKFDLYIPPNAEDFAGLLYKLYGRGEQGNKDMEFVKQTLLLPYERGENMISTYRQQISRKFKEFNNALKAFDNKFDKNAIKEIEDAGYTVDQAIRVWIWNKNGYAIPDITPKEEARLVEIVRKNPKLLGTALQFRNMFGGGRPYPEPSADWYGSNIKLDAHRYINKGARRMFLEEFINNSKEAFTPEFYAKAEAAFGKGYVKNLQQMLDAMITGQSRPENLPEYATLALNYLNGAVGNIMFLNNRSAILQTISMTNYINWTDNNILAAGKTLTNPKEFARTWMELMNSDFLKQRRDGLEISIEEAEIAKSLEDSQNAVTMLWGKLLKLGYTPTKFADSFAIASGGTPFYLNRTKTYLKQGFSEAEAKKMAFEDFRMLTETHQQSSRQDKISNVQRGLMGRLTYSFSGAPFQMAREQKKAALNFINRRGSDRENISKFFYYGAVQNLIFTAMQQGLFAAMFEDDEALFDKRTNRLANSMLDTFLRSSGLPGAMLAMGKNAIIKYMAENEKGYQGDMGNVIGEVLNISPPIGSKYRNIYGGLKTRKFLLHTKKGRAEVEASQGFLQNPLYHANARIIAGITNAQTNRLMSKAENMDIAITGRYDAAPWQRIALASGWDKWSLGFYDKKEEGPKKTRSEIMKEIWAEKKRQKWINDSIMHSKFFNNN